MVKTEVFDKLKELQDVLSQKYEIQSQIEEAPKRLSSQDELLARLKKEYIEKNSIYEDAKEKVKKLKEDLASAETSRESGEKGMDNITTHREYEALDKQITEASQREAEIRKELQKEEKYFSELDEGLKTDEAMIKSQEDDLNAGKDSLEKEMDKYKSQLSKLQKKEDAIVPGIDQEIVYKFQRIIQRNSQGIVAVKNGVCDGCHMILPAQFANEVHKGEKILFCPYCSRILYYQEGAENEESFYLMNDSGSLSDLDDDYLDDEEKEDLLNDDDESGKFSDFNADDEDVDNEFEDEEEDEEEDEPSN